MKNIPLMAKLADFRLACSCGQIVGNRLFVLGEPQRRCTLQLGSGDREAGTAVRAD
jgi:hypothetical protein